MPDWNKDGKIDGLDWFITRETCEQSKRPAPTGRDMLDTILSALFWIFLFLLACIFA